MGVQAPRGAHSGKGRVVCPESIEQRNLTIFVTPRIIQMSDRNEYEDARLRLRERLSGLNLRPKTEPEPNRTINEP